MEKSDMATTLLFITECFLFLLLLLMAILLAAGHRFQSVSDSDREERIPLCESLFHALMIIFIDCAALSFLLALAGLYSLQHINLVIALQSAGAAVFIACKWKKRGGKQLRESYAVLKNRIKYKCNLVLLLLLLLSAVLYCFFPTEYLWGRRDPALYVIKAVNIAEEGDVRVAGNSYLNENYEEMGEFTSLTYRGVYSDYEEGVSEAAGDITLQFLDFFPAVLAIGYSIAGLDGLFRVNGVIGVLCILSVYYLCKYLFGRRTATITAVWTAVNPAQLWCARIPQTELLFQLCWVLALYLFAVGWRKNKNLCAILSGCILGFCGLNRIDSYLLGLGVFAAACYCSLFIRGKCRFTVELALSYAAAAFGSFLYSVILSPYYIRDHWKAGVLSSVIYLNLAMLLLTLLLFMIGRKPSTRFCRLNFIFRICENPKWCILTGWLLFFVLRFVYYARPMLQKGENVDWDFNQRSLMEFSWYTTTAAIPLFVLGVYYFMRDGRIRREALLLFATGFSNFIIYIWKPGVAPDHIWASRRWAAVCFPFVFALAAFGLCKFTENLLAVERKWRLAQCLSALLLGGYLLYKCRLFLLTPMLSEMQPQYEALVEHMPQDQIYFGQMSHYSSILRFVYGRQVFVMKEDGAGALENYVLETGQPVYYIGEENIFDERVNCETLYEGFIEGTYILQPRAAYPTELIQTGAKTNLYKIGVKK